MLKNYEMAKQALSSARPEPRLPPPVDTSFLDVREKALESSRRDF